MVKNSEQRSVLLCFKGQISFNKIRTFYSILIIVFSLFFINPAWCAPNIGATKVDSFSDSDGDGKAEVGETIEYKITIENTGDEDAININIEDVLSPNVNFVPGSTVVARDDNYITTGNSLLEISETDGVLLNDFDPEGTALTVTGLNNSINLVGISAHGGEVEIFADGGFSYLPAPGFRGPIDTFTYICTDAYGNSVDALVKIEISEMVWYVDNTALSGDGRSSSPFNSLAPLNGTIGDVDEPGDVIFIFEGSGSYDGGIQLENDQKLIGQGVDLTINGKTLQTATNQPYITNKTGKVITLANNNKIRGVIVYTGSSDGIYGGGISGSVTISDTDIINNQGDGLSLSNLAGITMDINNIRIENNSGKGIVFVESTGWANLDNITVKGNNAAGLYMDNSSGNGIMDIDLAGIVFDENSGPELQITGGAPLIDFAGDLINDTGYIFNISDTIGGTINLVFNTITGTGGSGISIEDAMGTVNVAGLKLSGSSGINIQGSGGAFAFTNADINNVSGTAFNLLGGNANVTYSGNMTNSTGELIRINNLGSTGIVDFQSGTITANQGSKGINISNCAGSISFNQYIAGESANPITFNAIDLTANTAMVNFSDADIYTSGSKGVYANGGELNVSSGTLDTLDEMAMEIYDTALNMAFSSVFVNSNSSEGIKIENTTGTLHIDALNISTSSTGIILTNAGKVAIVTGFLTSSAGAAADIDNTLIDFGLTGISSTNSTMQGIDLTNLVSGSTLSVTGMTTVSNALSQGIRIDNAGAGSDIDFAAVEIADRNGTGLLIKNAQGSVDYAAITIPNPKAVGGYGIRIENSSASVSFESADISDTITTVAQTENIGIPTNEGDGDGIFLINNSGSFTLRGGMIRNSL